MTLLPHEVQFLAAVVGGLLPLIIPGGGHPSTPWQQASAQPFPLPPLHHRPDANLAASSQIEQQAALALVHDITASALNRLADYLERNAGEQRALESCVPLATAAAQCFAGRDYGQAFNLVWQAYQAITAARLADPGVPPLQDQPKHVTH